MRSTETRLSSRITVNCVLVFCGFATSQNAVVDADALSTLAVREELRIGNADDPKLGFNAIFGVAVDGDGQIFVYEPQAREIRVFARDGRPVRTIGRPGSGPGEFTRVSAFGVLGDTVWTFDRVERRLNLFRRNGALVATRTLEVVNSLIPLHGNAVGFIWPQVMRGDGSFVSMVDYTIADAQTAERMLGARGVTARPAAADTVKAPRLAFPASGTALDTIGWEPVPPPDGTVGTFESRSVDVNGIKYTVPTAPGDLFLRVSLADGSAVVTRRRPTSARSAEFVVLRYDMSGKPQHRLRFRYTPGRYAGAILDTLAMREAQRRAPDQVPAAFKAIRAQLTYPDFQAPVYTVWAANDTSLWVRREDNASAHFRWIVIERTGAVRGVAAIPRSARPVWARADTVLAVDTDNDGIPWLVRYRVVRPR